MPDEPGTSPDAVDGKGNARSHRANNKYYNTQRLRNHVGGLGQLTLITCSRTPALDLKKVKEALQNKIKREEKDAMKP